MKPTKLPISYFSASEIMHLWIKYYGPIESKTMQIMNYVKGRFCRNWIFLFQTYAMFWTCAHPDTRPISFTYAPMASMWVVTLHDPFLYSDPPLPCHPPSYWLRLFSSQTFSHINTPNILKPSHSSYLSAYEDGTECSEMSAYEIRTPENYPEESIRHSEHGESLKSTKFQNHTTQTVKLQFHIHLATK